MFAWIQGLDARCKALAAVLALVGSIVGGAWAFDARMDSKYAKSEDLVAQAAQLDKGLTDLKAGQLQSERRSLKRDQFELENTKKQSGRLTTFEEKRLQEVKQEITELEQEIQQLRKK